MMTDREKLVELLESHCSVIGEEKCKAAKEEICSPVDCAGCLADHLIANGVAVQNWRDARAEPPPQDEDVLLRFCNGTMVVGGLREDGGWYSNTDAEWYTDCESVPEKWQPLPEPQKEEPK